MAAKKKRIALMLDIDRPYQRHFGIFSGTQRYAEQHDWDCVVDEFVDHTLSQAGDTRPYDGIIARAPKRLANMCKEKGIPLVNVWANSPVRNAVDTVLPDQEAAGKLAAEHLLNRGLRSFAALVVQGSRASKDSCNSFAAAVKHVSPTCHFGNIPSSPTESLSNWKRTEQVLKTWMNQWELPIGVFVGTDMPMRLVAQMSQSRGWRVPEDVAIVAGSDENIICEHPKPSITSIKLGYEKVGYEAAKQLSQLMRKRNLKAVEPKLTMVPPQGLIVRQSTDFLAVDDEMVSAALKYISDNIHKPLGVDMVAAAIDAGSRTMQNRFRDSLGRSVAAEIRRVRVDRIKRELSRDKRTLDEIARDVGLKNPQRLCEVFHREVGMSPGAYRTKWKKP